MATPDQVTEVVKKDEDAELEDVSISGQLDVTGAITAASTLDVTGVATFTAAPVFSAGAQDNSNEAITATVGGGTTGLITQGTRFATVTSDTATKQISLPAATVGDKIDILVTGAACEMISAVAAHKVNEVVVGATNELALVEDSLYKCHYVAENTWIVRGITKLGADEAALVPDAL